MNEQITAIIKALEDRIHAADVMGGDDPVVVMSDPMNRLIAVHTGGEVKPGTNMQSILGCPVVDQTLVIVVEDDGSVGTLKGILENRSELAAFHLKGLEARARDILKTWPKGVERPEARNFMGESAEGTVTHKQYGDDVALWTDSLDERLIGLEEARQLRDVLTWFLGEDDERDLDVVGGRAAVDGRAS